MRLALDAEGGDYAPAEIVAGAVETASAHMHVLLVGRPEIIEPCLQEAPAEIRRYVDIVPATSVISFHDEPAWAVRNKPDSSIVIGARLVTDGVADGFISAGSTGAMLAAGLLVVKRIRGVKRPAILVVLPGMEGPIAFLDAGANANCRPEHLVEFGVMGAAFARTVLGIAQPRVGLLNIGEENSKGNELTVAAHRLLAGSTLNFVGNIEGRELLYNHADVVVTDGFTGNVALKLLEGTAQSILQRIRAAASSSARAKLGGLLLRPALQTTRASLDSEEYGGTYLLGVRGLVVICHGSSSRRAVANALRFAARAAEQGLVTQLPVDVEAALAASTRASDTVGGEVS
ncbi:MAG: phosphate acyltransferase PlsX [Actinobacteria bacterium]|nr:phosphate acyltransferase PlsX [Actinomycetota bacterium]